MSTLSLSRPFCLFVVLFLMAGVSTAATDLNVRDSYGGAVTIVGTDVIVGEYSGFSNPGMIHVLRENSRGSWDVVQTITSSDADVDDQFGYAIEGNTDILAVASPGALEGSGAVYLFARSRDGSWSQTGRLTREVPETGSRFASSVAVSGGRVYVGAPGAGDRQGAVHVFERISGLWQHASTIVADSTESGHMFGSSLVVSNGRLLVGAPGYDGSKGAVFVYSVNKLDTPAEMLSIDEAESGDRLGSSLFAVGSRVVATNPRANRAEGIAHVYESTGSGSFKRTETLAPDTDGDGPTFFGASVAGNAEEMWISAPLDNDSAGAIYRYDMGSLQLLGRIMNESGGGRSQFGAAIDLGNGVAAVGLPGDDYGLGSAALYVRADNVTWREVATYNRPATDLEPIRNDRIECEDGEAGQYACENINLVSFLPLSELGANRGVRLNDVWGWTDPETGAEIGIIGHMEAAVFVDLTNPADPVVLGELPRTDGSPGSTWRDMKVYKNHVFIVADGAGQHGMQVFDLTRLRDVDDGFQTFEPDVLYNQIASAHNIIINKESGYAYTVGNSSGGETCGGGLHMINIENPEDPTFVGCFNDPETGRNGSGATHDAQCVTYAGPDTEHRGKEICVGSNGTAISIADVSDKDHPVAISQGSYPNSAYVHQGWFTDDHRYFYQNDEADELSQVVDRTRTMIWDLSDLDEPEMIAEFYGDASSTDHNLYVRGDYMYQTNNASGLRIVDIRDRANPVEVGYFDTTPKNKNVAGFDGTWSSYPYFESGNILVTSRREGLFIVRKKEIDI